MKQIYPLISACMLTVLLMAQKKGNNPAPTENWLDKASLSGLTFRNIGPATTSGRISDLAVNPKNFNEYYLAFASGNVFKTTNAGTTYEPIFDNYGSYSIGCLAIDPNNTNVVWVGTGENNNQRSVAYGDGIYKSTDGGKIFSHMGLKNSEHIGMIAIDPRNSNVVYVAAYGPLWSDGGDRGLYKTTDGGKNWEKILDISKYTGVNEVHLDPRNPDVIYATAHQRRRHVWTYISGGPESAIYKSVDGGKTFEKLSNGLPSGDVGRIALAIPPTNPDIVYAMVEGHGFYRSTNRGSSFAKMSDHYTSGNYYVEIYPHPTNENIIYSMDTWALISKDGGRTFNPVPEKDKHVDNHCMWINPNNTDHILMGCDGGLYETWDNMQNWHWKPNLSTIQFYRVATDNALPFYNVYGGTQDNNSLGGPSRTTDEQGIINDDWIFTNGGDGFESQIDPTDPNIVYAQAQYGWLVRFDKASGENVFIQPQPGPEEDPYVWNWDAPLLISPHDNKTLYFCANKVFKSTDRGNNWTIISDDLTRKIDRNKLKVMDKVWSMDAIAYHKSTSVYGNLVSFTESPLKQGLIYAGSDDGLLHRTDNDGGQWKSFGTFPGVPERTYTQDIKASQHDENVVYAAFNNHKNGDFKPYILKSTNKGESWTSIAGNLPERGSIYSIAEDHINPNLLFVGTEFGVFFTIDGGNNWKQLKNGLPTIAVRDIEIQKRENDLILATFGRGFYILDDYSPLRTLSEDLMKKDAHVFEVKPALLYHQSSLGGIYFKGAGNFRGTNPPVGATFTYYIKESPKSLKAQRQEKEKELVEVPYPTPDAIRAENTEESAYLIFVISDMNNREIRRVNTAYGSGLQRFTWDGKFAATANLNLKGAPITNASSAFFAPEGNYQMRILQSVNGIISPLTENVSFEVKHLKNNTTRAEDMAELALFQQEIDIVERDLNATEEFYKETRDLINHLKAGGRNTPNVPVELLNNLRKLEQRLIPIEIALYGDRNLAELEFAVLPGLTTRMGLTKWYSWSSTSEPNSTQRTNLSVVREALPQVQAELKKINDETNAIKEQMYKAGAPYLRGDFPNNQE